MLPASSIFVAGPASDDSCLRSVAVINHNPVAVHQDNPIQCTNGYRYHMPCSADCFKIQLYDFNANPYSGLISYN